MYGFSQGLHTHEICIYIQLPPQVTSSSPCESKNSHRLNVVIAIALLDQTLTIVVHCLHGSTTRRKVTLYRTCTKVIIMIFTLINVSWIVTFLNLCTKERYHTVLGNGPNPSLSLKGQSEVSPFQRFQENASIQTDMPLPCLNPYGCGRKKMEIHRHDIPFDPADLVFENLAYGISITWGDGSKCFFY